MQPVLRLAIVHLGPGIGFALAPGHMVQTLLPPVGFGFGTVGTGGSVQEHCNLHRPWAVVLLVHTDSLP